MNCPHCNKSIEAATGFQEVEKFSKHLKKCKKNPNRSIIPDSVDSNGWFYKSENITPHSIKEALALRAESNQ